MRARNMQVLTDDILVVHPGTVIGGIGNPAHQEHASDHNEDDTPGSKPEQVDADSNPEHRAIDVMLGPTFSRDGARELVNALLADPAALARLVYIIFEDDIWSARYNWIRRDYTGAWHNHVHLSGRASQDENGAHWPAVLKLGDDMFTEEDRRKGNAVYGAIFNGGPSCGPAVPLEFVVNPTNEIAAQYRNSIFSQLNYVRHLLENPGAPLPVETRAIVEGVLDGMGSLVFIPQDRP